MFALAFLLLVDRGASALDASLDVSQYAHTAWKVRDGSLPGEVTAIAQTPDGYLWLGTQFGLLRFNGVHFTPWQPPEKGEPLPSSYIRALLVARDGTLWIGTLKGLASWKDGTLSVYPPLSGRMVHALLEDREGNVWLGSQGLPAPNRLCVIRKGAVDCTSDEVVGVGVSSLYEDGDGNVWVGEEKGLWRVKPGRAFYSLPGEANGIRGIVEDDRHALLVGWQGLSTLVDGHALRYSAPDLRPPFTTRKMLRDRDGAVWIAAHDRGLLHIHRGRSDAFAQSDGLSGNASGLFEDREGTIWVATEEGLDRFREFAVTTLTLKQGLSNAAVGSILADAQGAIWLATSTGLNRWMDGKIDDYGRFNGRAPNSMFLGSQERLWVSTVAEFGYFKDGRFVVEPGVPGGNVFGIAEDNREDLWIENQHEGLVRRSSAGIEVIPWAKFGHADFAQSLSADPVRGGLWLGFFSGGIVHFADGRVQKSYAASDGLGEGGVTDFLFDRQRVLWIATERGLSRLKNERLATIAGGNGLPCDAVHWVKEDDSGAFWLYMSCGLLRVERTELESRLDALERRERVTSALALKIFDGLDGVRTHAQAGKYTPQVQLMPDGKLWFLPWDGASYIDTRRAAVNRDPPPTHIEQITADRKTYAAAGEPVILPPLVRDVGIDYTALSFIAPEKTRFRYKLEGRDDDWQNVGNSRRALYSDLPPGDYRFRVQASYDSGVWNEQGTAVSLSVAPAYWQTNWFRLLCVVAFFALLWALYYLRMRQVARSFRKTMDARVGERTRIARELHDTLLQSFQGVLLLFQTVYEMLPAEQKAAKDKLAGAIDLSAAAIAEGRDAVQGLRSSVVETNDLAQAIKTTGEDLVAEQVAGAPVAFQVGVQGAARALHPIVRDEIHRIAGEALRNAFRHARATQIEVELLYDERLVRVRVRDDGTGIDPKFISEGAPEGHYGLHGMRERAQLIGGKLTIWSGPNSGTEVELAISAAHAYATSAR